MFDQHFTMGVKVLLFFVTDTVQWNEVCESTPISKHQAETCFTDLADAFVTLQLHSKYWTEDDIVSVIDELTGEFILNCIAEQYCKDQNIAEVRIGQHFYDFWLPLLFIIVVWSGPLPNFVFLLSAHQLFIAHL